MAVKSPKQLVIDADIAFAASNRIGIDPTPVVCRDFLLEVRRTGHRMVLTEQIAQEWDAEQ